MTGEPTTLLLVDDTPENLDLMKAILSPLYKVRVAINGEAALKLLSALHVDLVLLDIMMPGLDGYEVCRRLKQDPAKRDLPVVLVSAINEAVDDGKGFEAGAVDYVVKPISAPVLLARVKVHLALAAQSRKLSEIAAGVERVADALERGGDSANGAALRGLLAASGVTER